MMEQELQPNQQTEERIKLDAKIKQLQKATYQNKKALKNIEKSNTWKYTKPIRKLHGLLMKAAGKDASEHLQQLFDLKSKTEHLEQQLSELYHQHQRLLMQSPSTKPQEIKNLLKELEDQTNLIESLHNLAEQKRASDVNYHQALTSIARKYQHEKPEYRNYIYNKVLESFKLEEVPEFIVRAAETDAEISLAPSSSLQANLTRRARQKQLGEELPEYVLDQKEVAYAFIDSLGVKRPLYSTEKYTVATIPKQEDIVIKPINGAGSRGVYLVYGFSEIFDIKRQKLLSSWEQLIENMQEDLEQGWVAADEWMTEEFIYENKETKTPARDIKFYSFYGKVGLILEIQRYPELKYCWWDGSGKRIRTGKYDQDLFVGQGVTPEELAQAEKISLAIPAPFIRIDFLKSQDGLLFGEFTPKPGNYDEFNKDVDRELGDDFLQAESRLTNDLINGKQFEKYQNIKQTLASK